MKKLLSLIVIMLLIATTLSVAGTVSANWSMYRNNPERTGKTLEDGPNSNNLLWSYDMPGWITSSPVVVDGMTYIGGSADRVEAINPDGTLKWSFDTGTGEVLSTPAISDGKVVFGSRFDKIYCVDAETGNENWNKPVGDWADTSPVIVNNHVYIAANPGVLYCLNLTDGTEVWSTSGVDSLCSPAVSNGKVYIGGNFDGMFHCYDAATGMLEYSINIALDPFDLPGISKTIAIDGDYAYFGIYGFATYFAVFCLDLASQDVEWTYSTPNAVSTAAAIDDNNVYIAYDAAWPDTDGTLVCLDKTNGDFVWSFSTPEKIASSPSVANGNVYFGSNDNFTYCLDLLDGTEIWSYDCGADVTTSPAITNDNLYVGSYKNGMLYCFGETPNQPPEIPATPSGPTEGEPNIEYTFATATTDPDEDNVYYMFDWGNGEFSDWLGPYASGDEIEALYTWTEEGTYDVKVKAKDTNDQETDYSDAHTMEIAEVPDPEPALSIKSIEGGKGITLVLENTGDADASDIEFTIKIEGGLFVLPREMQGSMNLISAGEQLAATEMPVFGIGLGILTDMPVISVSAECAEGSSDDDSVEAQIIFSNVTIQ